MWPFNKYFGKRSFVVGERVQRLEAGYEQADPGRRVLSSLSQALGASGEDVGETVLRERRSKLRVAAILDDFSSQCFAPECDLLQLSPTRWSSELASLSPDLLLVESAWRGKDGEWGSRVSHLSTELRDVLSWCRQNNVPSAFWNKEDPVHFQTFLTTAMQFDAVFTTDIDCIKRYKAELQHGKVFLLPFACQPELHNPMEIAERQDGFCFAGSYYARYPERTKDLESLVKCISSYKPLHIYDRNFGKGEPDYEFPKAYSRYIVGTLPPDDIDRAYKGYRFGINLNSVKTSQSMFARRVCELLASNTITVSNYSRGLRLMFGDLVISSDSGEEVLRRVVEIDRTQDGRIRLAGLRKVLLEHTYGDRLAFIASKLDLTVPSPRKLPTVTILASAENEGDLETLLAHFARQATVEKRMIVAVGPLVGPSPLAEPPEGVRYIPFGAEVATSIGNEAGLDTWIGGFSPNDYYGENYLLDLVLATKYSTAKVIGKQSYFSKAAELVVPESGGDYRLVGQLAARRSIVHSSLMAEESLIPWARNAATAILSESDMPDAGLLSVDCYNYCENGATDLSGWEDMTSKVDDLSCLSRGMSLDEMVTFADRLPPESVSGAVEKPEAQVEVEARSEAIEDPQLMQTGSADISAAQLAGMTALPKDGSVVSVCDGDDWTLTSHLPDGKHVLLYQQMLHRPSDLMRDGQLRLFLSSSAGLYLMLAVFFLDAQKQKLGSKLLRPNENHSLMPPDGTEWVRLAVRVLGKGSCTIRKLSFETQRLWETGSADISAARLATITALPKDGSVVSVCDGDDWTLTSHLPDGKHVHLYQQMWHRPSDLMQDGQLRLFLSSSAGLYIKLAVFFLDAQRQKLGSTLLRPNENHSLVPPEGTEWVRLAVRVFGKGSCTIHKLSLEPQAPRLVDVLGSSHSLVLTNHYPSYSDIYRNGFVHSRVVAYRKLAGVEVDVYRLRPNEAFSCQEFGNIDYMTGSCEQLDHMLAGGRYTHVLVHFLSPEMWQVLQAHIDRVRVTVWVHGAEVQPWWRRAFNFNDDAELAKAKAASAKRLDFWRQVLCPMHENLGLVFVSNYFAQEVLGDLEVDCPQDRYEIIHNPIDDHLFSYEEKAAEQRKKILSIRPFASAKYANDLTVQAILLLSGKEFFDELEFCIVGDGPLFDEITRPLLALSNVKLVKRFLNHEEIATLHKEYGVFLCPTRMDAQGVSRDEAMSSGLVPVTSRVAAIPEFVDESCAYLADAEDAAGLADAIAELYRKPDLFLSKSRAAAERVRRQSSIDRITAAELALFTTSG